MFLVLLVKGVEEDMENMGVWGEEEKERREWGERREEKVGFISFI